MKELIFFIKFLKDEFVNFISLLSALAIFIFFIFVVMTYGDKFASLINKNTKAETHEYNSGDATYDLINGVLNTVDDWAEKENQKIVKTCPVCDGLGVIYEEGFIATEKECPRCDGFGVVPK